MSGAPPRKRFEKKSEDGMDATDPLVLKSRALEEQPPLKFPIFDLPKPVELTPSDRDYVERSRFLNETYKYSGYYVIPDVNKTALLQKHGLVSSSFAPDTVGGGSGQQIYTPTFERYSDRYRKILGKKTFHSEIAEPNTALFPAELLSDKNGRLIRQAARTTFTSKVQFLNTKTLMNEVSRLVTTTKSSVVDDATGGVSRMDTDEKTGGDAEEGQGGARGEEDGEEEEEEQQNEEEDEDMDDDYGDNYRDDDEDGGADALGDDGGDDGETM